MSILAERLRRQNLIPPLDDRGGYIDLFRSLQPVSPRAYSRPGSPPQLAHRTTFSDGDEADKLRADRTIVKGRFLGGTIGYVLADDLELYANAFCRPLPSPTYVQQTVLDAVTQQSPLTPRLVKAETGLLNKKVMPALHRLQQAFLVYEDQVDDDWKRGWYDFAAEWPEVQISEGLAESAAVEVVRQFVGAYVFATEENLKDWSGWPKKRVQEVIARLQKAGEMVDTSIIGFGKGWMSPGDTSLGPGPVPPNVLMLDGADILVRSQASDLKRRFGDREVLRYLLIDGQVRGAVVGHWRTGPHDVEDIVVELPADERASRQEEVLEAVRWGYRPPTKILKYDGRRIN